MFERFTDQARRVVVHAQEEAGLLNHDHIGTAHLLLGLLHERDGVAAHSLRLHGIGLAPARSRLVEIIGRGGRSPSGHLSFSGRARKVLGRRPGQPEEAPRYIPFSPRAKKVLELSLREALQPGHSYIGAEHILLGLIREGDGMAAQVLEKLGADLPGVRRTALEMLPGDPGEESGGREDPARSTGAPVQAAPDCIDSIALRGLRVRAHHGVMEQERTDGQTFVVDVTARLDLSAAGRSDELVSTLDYGTLAEAIHRRVSGEQWNLIERVAERVADLVLEDRRVSRVEVTVHKPEAPIAVEFEDVAVTIVRLSPDA